MQIAPFIVAMTVALGLAPIESRAAETPSDSLRSETNFVLFPGWQRVMAQSTLESVSMRRPIVAADCKTGKDCAVAQWDAFIQQTSRLPRDQQIEAVNTWVNAHPYVEDWANWGLPDYWETPEEFLTRGGDCEDFAITKYYSLIRLGFSPADLRIVVVKDQKLQMFHAILSVQRPGAETVVLDNQAAQVVPMAVAVNYRPIYSLNAIDWRMETQPRFASNPMVTSVRIVTAAGH